MQDPINPTDDGIIDELRKLSPLPSSQSKLDLWYAAGFKAAQRRSRKWHIAAVTTIVGIATLSLLRPQRQPSVRIIDRVVYVQPPTSPPPQPISFASALENHRQMEDAVQDRFRPLSTGGHGTDAKPLAAWMSDLDPNISGGM